MIDVAMPFTEGDLESVLALVIEDGLPVENRPVHWSQAHGSALLLGGTLSGVKVAQLHESLVDPQCEDLEIAIELGRRYYALLSDEDGKGGVVRPLIADA